MTLIIADIPPQHTDLESAHPIEIVAKASEQDTNARPITAHIEIGRDAVWKPTLVSPPEGAVPVSSVRELPHQAEADTYEYGEPLVPAGKVRLHAVRGEWPLPDWD